MLLLSFYLACSLEKTPELFSLPLIDTNESSLRFGQEVALDDFAGKVSLWYFGHAT